MTEKSRQKFKYAENEKRFSGEIKTTFIIFKGLSVAKNYLRPEIASLRLWHMSNQQKVNKNWLRFRIIVSILDKNS